MLKGIMKTTKILLLFILYWTTAVITSCCNCPPVLQFQYNFSALQVSHINNAGAAPTFTSSETSIHKDAYGIKATLTTSVKQIASAGGNTSLFINAAHGFSCECMFSDYEAKDSVTDIKIIDLNKFDNGLLPGADVTDKFAFTDYSYIPVTDLKKTFPYPNIRSEKQEDIKAELDLFLMKPPAVPLTHQFKIIVTFKNGTSWEQTTAPVYLF